MSFTHPLSARVYSVMERGGSFYLRRTQLPAGAPLEKSIDYVIGSGNHSKTFVHRDGQGRLFELPVSWYSEGGGYWAMSPGYDRRDHSDFRREVSDTCLFCHNGYPSEANGGLAQGIDCQRCHGRGEEHVKSKGAIVNPARLSRSLQMDVCMQCHLESASRTLPDAIRRFDRGPFSYRPGEPLKRFKLYFQFAGDKSEARGGITVNNSAYGLRQSPCFQKSGRLTCTTCHDPHVALRGEEAERRYTAVCRSCHNTVHDPETRTCSACHMPKRRTEDAVHVVMTDHFIRRRPEMGDAPIAERHDRQLGRVKLLFPERLSNGPESELYVALAQLSNSPNPVQDIPRLEQAIKAARPQSAEPYRAVAAAYRKSGRVDQAVTAYRTVLEKDSGDAGTYVVLGDILSESGRIDEAIAVVQSRRRETTARHIPAQYFVCFTRASEPLRPGARSGFECASNRRRQSAFVGEPRCLSPGKGRQKRG